MHVSAAALRISGKDRERRGPHLSGTAAAPPRQQSSGETRAASPLPTYLSPFPCAQGGSAVAGGITPLILLTTAALFAQLELNQCLIFYWTAPSTNQCVESCGGDWRTRWRLNVGICCSICRLRRKLTSCLTLNSLLAPSVLADIVAPYVYACWQICWKVRNERSARMSAGPIDGSDAMA
jgi:hypothetical protein